MAAPLQIVQPEDLPEAPSHLSDEARSWWGVIVSEYRLDPHHLRLLRLACESWDAAQDARRTLEAEESVFLDRFGQPKQHPAHGVWRDNVGQFQRLVRELQLDAAPPPDSRPPRLY